MSIKNKPAENTAAIVGVAVSVAELLHVKVDAATVTKLAAAAPFVVSLVPHAVTAAVDFARGRKVAAAAEFQKAVDAAVDAKIAAEKQPVVVS